MRVARCTHHADLPLFPRRVVRVGGGLVRGLGAHRVLEGVAAERHALARIVVLVAALLVHEQLVAVAREAGALGGVRFGVRCGLRSCDHVARVLLSRFLPVGTRCRLLLRFLYTDIGYL